MPEAWCKIVDLRHIGRPNSSYPPPHSPLTSLGLFWGFRNLLLVEHIYSAEDSCLIPGWASQNHNHMIHLSHPPNERFVIHISFRSGDPRTLTYPTDLILRSDRPDDIYLPSVTFSDRNGLVS